MNAVLSSIAKAFGQLGDPAIVRVAVKSIAITVAIFLAGGFGLYYALTRIGAEYSWSSDGWLEAVAAALIAIITFWFLFRVVALAVLQFFADEIVAAVEARHYPDLADKAKPLPLPQDLANSLRGMARALGFNLLALPFAAVLLFTAIGPAVVFLAVNAVLLGRELTDMAWLRHSEGIRRASPVPGAQRLMLGAIIAGMMLIPFANLVAPVVGAAAGTHLAHHAMQRTTKRNA